MAQRTKYPVSEYKKYRETLTPDEIKKIEGKVVDYFARNKKIPYEKFDYWTRVHYLIHKDEKLQKERDRKKAIRDKAKAEQAKADKLREAEEAKKFLEESAKEFERIAAERKNRENNRKEVESANNSKGTISKPNNSVTSAQKRDIPKTMSSVIRTNEKIVVNTKNQFGDENVILDTVKEHFERKQPVYAELPPKPLPSEKETGVVGMTKFRFRSGDTYEQMIAKVKYIRQILRGKTMRQKIVIIVYYDIALEKEKRGNNIYLYGGKNLKNRKYKFYLGRDE